VITSELVDLEAKINHLLELSKDNLYLSSAKLRDVLPVMLEVLAAFRAEGDNRAADMQKRAAAAIRRRVSSFAVFGEIIAQDVEALPLQE
jgi:hypothetical protein